MPTISNTITPPLPPQEVDDAAGSRAAAGGLVVYLLLGVAFGVLLIKSEVVSWFRIQEMFRFQGFHMYGILGSAVGVAAISLQVIRRLELRTLSGETIEVPPKTLGKGYRYGLGGICFGLGWSFIGACPGPILALIGYGIGPFLAVFGAALAGTWSYGRLRPWLPH